MAEDERLHRTWLHSDRYVPSRFVRPALRFTEIEAAGGVVLLLAAIAAVIWANSPWSASYFSFWDIHIDINLGAFHFSESLKHFVNDGLMAIFFFIVGMEIKRELVKGELRDPRQAALPALAAVGGMVVPALVYVAFTLNSGGEAVQGWGVPMATDIAFSLGVLSLLGSRISVGAKLFLLALAIADDIGAIAVIAIFYTDQLSMGWLLTAIGGLVAVRVASLVGIRSMIVYSAIGTFVWFAVLESGVHATLAGVALGLLTPAYALYSDEDYRRRVSWIVQGYERDAASPDAPDRIDQQATDLVKIARESVSPLDRIVHALHPWSSFVIVPLFALANAGVSFAGVDLGEAVTHPVSLGVALGLFAGKAFGITGMTWLAVKLKLGKLPPRTSWRDILGLATLAGIGFTVALFIAELAFTDELITDRAKIGIFVGSTLAGVVGYLLLRTSEEAPVASTPVTDPELVEAQA
ncbi:MAG: Na+/H+ antiporter NhaA [Acidimicrobiia bacterium]|nr:Na+/H+ antiporter NhaA [Acidimicrobiia bacterium]NNF63895.1 Na+/H+ antiporter NhaA [Acidimicrobiia bacterium]